MGRWFCFVLALANSIGLKLPGTERCPEPTMTPTLAPSVPSTTTPEQPIAERDTDQLFSMETLAIFKLTLPPGRFEQLQEDALLEEYVEASLQYNDESVGDIGLRFKGSTGSLYNCFDDDGNRICDKLSMKIKFTEVDEDLRFFGLKKLNFHSMKQDRTKIAEKISYKVFRDAGIAAPRSSWARLEVNGEELGLFSLVEQIDGRFTKDRFEEGDGDLYKQAWPDEEDPSDYDDKVETNEDTATHDRISRFAINMISAAPENRLETLENWTSLDEMYTFMAVQDAVAQWDGVTAWYCSNNNISKCSNHNFYWYSQETSDHFTLIPWDMDGTMDPNTLFDKVPHWTQKDVDCDSGYFREARLVRAAGCDPILGALASDMDRYAKAVDEILQGAFDIEKIANDIKLYTEFIQDEVERDRFGDSVDSWRGQVSDVEEGLPILKLRLEGFRDGILWDGFTMKLTQDSVNTFEDVGALDVALAVSLVSNAATSISVFHNVDDPIAGISDIRLDFGFRDDGDIAYSQYLGMQIPMADEQADLTSLSGVRIKLLSDRFREIRVNVESPENSSAGNGVTLGWSTSSGGEATAVELYFADMAIPEWAQDNGFPIDDPNDIQRTVNGLTFSPLPVGRNCGLLGENVADIGFLQVDDVEFF